MNTLEYVNGRVISQLIKGISSVLQKMLRYFNGTIILTSSVTPFPVCPVIFCLNLLVLFTAAPAADVSGTVIVPLTSIYALL